MEKKKEHDIVETRHGSFKTTFNKKHTLRKPWVPYNPKHVRSAIPGTVMEILVQEGQSVKTGDTLMVYKAMKMNNIIKSPADGKVAKIHVKAGDNVRNGVVMIELE